MGVLRIRGVPPAASFVLTPATTVATGVTALLWLLSDDWLAFV